MPPSLQHQPLNLGIIVKAPCVIICGSLLTKLKYITHSTSRDPQRSRTDAELISALRRAWLLPQVGVVDAVAEAKFSLDSSVGDEGGNFSAGERQLLALCRALVKNSKIILLVSQTYTLAHMVLLIPCQLRTRLLAMLMLRLTRNCKPPYRPSFHPRLCSASPTA